MKLFSFKILFLHFYAAVLMSCTSEPVENNPPNIILIYTDDLGYGDVSPFEPKASITPNLHKLAQEGTILTNFYVASSVCSPSRASLLTGSYPVRIGIPGNLLRMVSLGPRTSGDMD